MGSRTIINLKANDRLKHFLVENTGLLQWQRTEGKLDQSNHILVR